MKNVVIISLVGICLLAFMGFGYSVVQKSRIETLQSIVNADKIEKKDIQDIKDEEDKKEAEKKYLREFVKNENKRHKEYQLEVERQKRESARQRTEGLLRAKKEAEQREFDRLLAIEMDIKEIILFEIKDVQNCDATGKKSTMKYKYLRWEDVLNIQDMNHTITVYQHIKDGKHILFTFNSLFDDKGIKALELGKSLSAFNNIADGEGGYLLLVKTDRTYKYDIVGIGSQQKSGIETTRLWVEVDTEMLVNNIYRKRNL